MIRTTITKIKKVCTIAFLPQLLGEIRYSPSIYAAFGKFEKYASNVQKCARKSTKSTDDDAQSPEILLKDKVAVEALCEPLEHRNNINLENGRTGHNVASKPQNMPNQTLTRSAPSLCNPTATVHHDECNRVISEIFGEERGTHEEVLTITNVGMPDAINNSKIVIDTRNQLGICDSKILARKFGKDDLSSKDMTALRKANTETNIKPAESDAQQLYTNLYDVDPEEHMPQRKIDTETLRLASSKKTADHEMDAYWTDVYESSIEKNTLHHEPHQAIDTKSLSMKTQKHDSKDTTIESRRIKHTSEELDRILNGSPYDMEFKDVVLNSTTAKQNEERLAQKLEHFDETPLVEAATPKVEGFNVSPKVLGKYDKPINLGDKDDLDNMANRCLNLPQTQVDNILLKEMEKFRVSASGQRLPNGLKPDETMTLNSNIRMLNPSMNIPNNLSGLGGIKLRPSTLQAEKQYWFHSNGTTITEEPKNVVHSNTLNPDICSEKVDNPNYCAEEVARSNIKNDTTHDRSDESVSNQKDEQKGIESPEPTLEKSDPIFNEDIWKKDQLDPKQVLTCNETCPISPNLIMSTNRLNNLKGTESMFGRSVLADCVMAQKEKGYDMKLQTFFLQLDDNLDTFALREINRTRYKFNNANVKDAKPLDAYLKTIGRENVAYTVEAESSPKTTEEPMLEEGSELTSKSQPTTLMKQPILPVIGSTPLVQNEEPPQLIQMENTSQEPLNVPIPYSKEIVPSTEHVKKNASFSELQRATNPSTMHENLCNMAGYKTQETTEDSTAHLVESIQATSNQLYATSEQLQATSKQLHATSEKLEVTSEHLQATSKQLQATSKQLEVTNEKFMKPFLLREMDGSESLVNHPSAELSVNPSNKTVLSVSPFIESPSAIPTVHTKEIESKQRANDPTKGSKGGNTAATLNASITGEIPTSLGGLPKEKDIMKLSELMRIVKERNQLLSSNLVAQPAEAKDKEPIAPMQQPRHNSPVFKTPGYPKLKPSPKVCTPKKKPKKHHCSRCDLEALGLRSEGNKAEVCQQESQCITLANDALPAADLTEDIVLQLKNFGDDLVSGYQRRKTEFLEAAVLAKTRHQHLFRTKDYEPWAPIPSWPQPPKKYKRPKLQCPCDGCPITPPCCVQEPPNPGLKPCKTFPTYPKRTFTVLDYRTVVVGDHTVVEIGEF